MFVCLSSKTLAHAGNWWVIHGDEVRNALGFRERVHNRANSMTRYGNSSVSFAIRTTQRLPG
eukprot:1856665-Amphidinium_carterae.1